MKLANIILFLSAALFIIAVHQTIIHGLNFSYGLFMIDGFLFLWYMYMKNKHIEKTKNQKKKK